MSLDINLIEIKDVVVLELAGDLDTNTVPDAEKMITKFLDSGTKKMIFNLENTNYVSSAGLRIFFTTAKKITSSGGAIKLCSPNEVVQEILDISGFSTILDIKKTQEEALKAI